jgi:Phage integrase family
MAKAHLKLVTPAIKKRAVTPRRRPNSELRSREHLTETEVDKLIEAANDNRHGHRDATMTLVAYRHGLRASEVCDLRWEQIDWNSATLHVRRVKSGKPSTHPIRGDELRALRKLQREAPKSPFVFVSERGGPFTTDSFNWMVKRVGQKAGLPFQVHAHMLRHAAGYKLAGDGHDTRSIQDYLGHKNIQHTVRYTELSPTRFQGFLARLRTCAESRMFEECGLLADQSGTLVGVRQLLVSHPDFTDDIEIRPVRLEHEKFSHTNCWLEKNVGDVEIVGNHHQIRGVVVVQNFLQNAFIIQFGLTVRDYARWLQILNGSRATKRKPAGVHAAAIGAGQNLPNRNPVSAEGFSDTLGLLFTAGGKIYFCRAVSWREPPYPFSDVEVSVTQQNNLAAPL